MSSSTFRAEAGVVSSNFARPPQYSSKAVTVTEIFSVKSLTLNGPVPATVSPISLHINYLPIFNCVIFRGYMRGAAIYWI